MLPRQHAPDEPGTLVQTELVAASRRLLVDWCAFGVLRCTMPC